MRKKILVAAAMIIVCTLPLLAQEKPAAPKPVREIKVQKASLHVLKEVIATSGVTAAAKRSRLNFQVPGVVSEVMVEMGQRVKEGEPLARLDDANYRLYLEQAQASFDAASANLEKLKSGFRPEEIAQAEAGVEAARAALEKFTSGFRPEDVKAAEAGLAAAQAAYEQAERNFERMKKLYEEKKAVAEATYEQARTQYEVAKAQRDQAKQHLDTARAGYEREDIESLQARFKQAAEQLALIKKGFRVEDIKAASSQVAVAEAALKLAKKQLQDTVLCAPYDGVVVDTYVDPGDSAGAMPGQAAVEIMDISSLEIVVAVADVWAETLTESAYAVIDLDGGPKGVKARVAAVSDAIDPMSRAFKVKLVLDNTETKLKAGMFARVRLVYNEITALAVPSQAVLEDGNVRYVMTIVNGKAKRANVTTGITSEGYTQVVSGLAEGAQVIHEGNFGLRDGAQVKFSGDDSK